MKAAIKACRYTARGDDVAFINVQNFWLNGYVGVALCEIIRGNPMRCCAFTIEKPCLCQRKCTQTQPDHLGAACMGSAQCIEQFIGSAPIILIPAGHDNDVSGI